MTRVDAIYARQSADRADSISIESQIEFCQYETHGEPCKIYADRGYSGKNTERPEFRLMMNEIKEGRIKRVICYKLDRCSRSILDFTTLMEFFRIHDVEFLSCTEKFDTSSPMGRAMLNICIVFAQLERETIQQRVYDAYHVRCKHGFYMGGRIPFGYKLQSHMLEGKKTSCYVPDPLEAPILRKIYDLYAQPDSSLSDVIHDLQLLEMRNPRREDGLWIRSHVGRLLRNPIYVKADLAVYYHFKEKNIQIQNPPEDFASIHGCYLYTDRTDGSKLLVLAPHDGIVASDIWLSCREKGRGGKEFHPSGVKHTWLAGRIKCGKCGYAMIVRKMQNTLSFRCSMSLESKTHCSGVGAIPVEWVERNILPELKRQLTDISCHSCDAISSNTSKEKNEDLKIAELEAESEALMRKLPDANPVVFTCIQKRLSEIDLQLKESLFDIEKAEMVRANTEKRERPDYAASWETLTPEKKLQIAHLLLKRVEVYEDSLTVQWEL